MLPVGKLPPLPELKVPRVFTRAAMVTADGSRPTTRQRKSRRLLPRNTGVCPEGQWIVVVGRAGRAVEPPCGRRGLKMCGVVWTTGVSCRGRAT